MSDSWTPFHVEAFLSHRRVWKYREGEDGIEYEYDEIELTES